MARKEISADSEESAGGFERILIVLIPVIFTIVLVGALLMLFNGDVRSGMLETANKIPIVKNWVPDPVLTPEEEEQQRLKKQEESAEATVKVLKQELEVREQSIKELTEANQLQASKVQQLETELEELLNQEAAVTEPEEDPYMKQIEDLAKMYADMSPSKAAPIMQNLTMEEMVLMLGQMKSSSRSAVLEKMDPKIAAEATMMLKDAKPSQDQAIAALQSRIQKNSQIETVQTKDNLDKNQLSQTFSRMTPSSAADLLIETYGISPAKAVTILNTVDDGTRASILNAMSAKDAELTARLLNRLMGSK